MHVMKFGGSAFADASKEMFGLNIALIGMSNCGKSYWSRRLADECDFNCICCDDNIEVCISSEEMLYGTIGIKVMAEWIGMPDSETYPARELAYLRAEEKVVEQAIQEVTKKNTSFVIDTTGSVIYLSESIQSELGRVCTVVYLEANQNHIQSILDSFFRYPKPLVWAGKFLPTEGETRDETLKRCYPDLLLSREKQYRKLAHVVIPFEDYHHPLYTADDLFYAISKHE